MATKRLSKNNKFNKFQNLVVTFKKKTMVAPLIAAGVAQGVGAIASSAIQNRQNRKLAEYGYSKDLEMWHRQNAYNDPKQQMSRLKEAGLNPNLVYGSGSTTGNTGSQMPKYQAPKMDYSQAGQAISNVGDQIGQYMSLKKMGAEINYIDANTIARNSQTDLLNQQAQKAGLDVSLFKDTYGQKVTQSQTTTQLKQQGLANLREVNRQLKADTVTKKLQAKALSGKIKLDEFEIELNKYGLSKSDSKLLRMLVEEIRTGNIIRELKQYK